MNQKKANELFKEILNKSFKESPKWCKGLGNLSINKENMVQLSLKNGELEIIELALMKTENADITEIQLKNLNVVMEKIEKLSNK